MELRHVWSVFFIYMSQSSAASIELHTGSDEEDRQAITEYISRNEVDVQSHTVITEDGYILTYHRLVNKGSTGSVISRKPILLQHPLAASSAAWLVPRTNQLAYMLLKSGYDVWLGNSRGSRYSRGHKSLHHTSKDYWDFGVHEMAVLDLSAGIDYILKQYKGEVEKLYFMGHSHGATQALILSAVRPPYQAKLSGVIVLAPAVYLTGLANTSTEEQSVARSIIDNVDKIAHEREDKGLYNVIEKATDLFHYCEEYKLNCNEMRNVLAANVPMDSWVDIYRFLPSGLSIKVIHYVVQQIINGPVFKNYEYSDEENILHYNTTDPPVYDLSNIKIPVHIFYSQSDLLVPTQDIMLLKDMLEKSSLHLVSTEGTIRHLDLLWGHQSTNLVAEVLALLNNDISPSSNYKYKYGFTVNDGKEKLLPTYSFHTFSHSNSSKEESTSHHMNSVRVEKGAPHTKYSYTYEHKSNHNISPGVKVKTPNNNPYEAKFKENNFIGTTNLWKFSESGSQKTENVGSGNFKNEKSQTFSENGLDTTGGLQSGGASRKEQVENFNHENFKPWENTKNSMSDWQNSESTQEFDELIKKLHQYKQHIFTAYNITIGDGKSNFDKYNLKKLQDTIENSGNPCVGECEEVKLLVEKVNKYLQHIKKTYLSESNRQDIDKSENSGLIRGKDGYFVPGSKTDFSGAESGEQVDQLHYESFTPRENINNSTSGWKNSESTLEYGELIKRLNQYKNHIATAYNITIGNGMTNLEKQNLKKLQDTIENSDECVGECEEVKLLVKEANKYLKHIKETFLSGTNANGFENSDHIGLIPGAGGYFVPAAGTDFRRRTFNWNQMEVAMRYFKVYNELRQYYKYIFSNYQVQFDYNSIEREFIKLKTLKKVINQHEEDCSEECRIVRDLLKNVEADSYTEGFESISVWDKSESVFNYFEIIYRLRQHETFISFTYKITFDYNSIESELRKIDEIADKINNSIQHCNGECENILRLFEDARGSPTSSYINPQSEDTQTKIENMDQTRKNIFDSSNWKSSEFIFAYFGTLAKLSQYFGYISNTFHISFDSKNIESELKKLKDLSEKVYKPGEDCTGECATIQSLISDVKQRLEIESFDNPSQWMNSAHIKDYLTTIYSLQQYSIYISNTFHIIFQYNKIESEFKKMEDLVNNLKNIGDQCGGECNEISKIIIDAQGAAASESYDSNSSSINSGSTFEYFAVLNKIRTYWKYISSTFDINLDYSQIESEFRKMEDLADQMDKYGHECNLECIEIHEILEGIQKTLEEKKNFKSWDWNDTKTTVKYFEVLYKIKKHETFILENYNIIFEYGKIQKELQKLDQLAEIVAKSTNKCVGECEMVGDLLKNVHRYFIHIKNAYFDNDGAETDGSSINEQDVISSFKKNHVEDETTKLNKVDIFNSFNWKTPEFASAYFETLFKLSQHFEYISNTFHISFDSKNIESELNKLKELSEKVYQTGEDCTGECATVKSLLSDVKKRLEIESFDNPSQWMNSAHIKDYVKTIYSLQQYSTYISNTFHIIFQYNKIESEFKKMEDLFNNLKNIGEQCGGECTEISKIIIDAQGAAPSESYDSNSRNINSSSTFEYFEVLNKIRTYWEYISSTFDINLDYSHIESEFRKMEDLADQMDKYGHECNRECIEIHEILEGIQKTLDEKTNLKSWDWNDTKTTVKYFEVLYKLKKHETYILKNYNIIFEYGQIETELLKLDQLAEIISKSTRNCVGECELVSNLLKNVHSYLIYIKNAYFDKTETEGSSTSESDAVSSFKNDPLDDEIAKLIKEGIFHSSNWRKTEFASVYFSMLVKLSRYEEYVSNTFHIMFDYSSIGSELNKLKELAVEIYKTGEDCSIECTAIRDLLNIIQQELRSENFDNYSIWINSNYITSYFKIIYSLSQYQTHISNTYHITFDYSKFERAFTNVENLSSKLIELGEQCTGTCREIRELLQNTDRSFYNLDDPVLNDLLKRLKRYQKHIQSVYNITIGDEKPEINFKKIKELENVMNHSVQQCTGECREIREMIRNVNRFRKHVEAAYLSDTKSENVAQERLTKGNSGYYMPNLKASEGEGS